VLAYLFRVNREKYGNRDNEGVSPTEREYDEATRLHKTRFIFITNHEFTEREQEVKVFIEKLKKKLYVTVYRVVIAVTKRISQLSSLFRRKQIYSIRSFRCSDKFRGNIRRYRQRKSSFFVR